MPAVAAYLSDKNKEGAEGHLKINLKGVGIGNGLTDPLRQYPQVRFKRWLLFSLFFLSKKMTWIARVRVLAVVVALVLLRMWQQKKSRI